MTTVWSLFQLDFLLMVLTADALLHISLMASKRLKGNILYFHLCENNKTSVISNSLPVVSTLKLPEYLCYTI